MECGFLVGRMVGGGVSSCYIPKGPKRIWSVCKRQGWGLSVLFGGLLVRERCFVSFIEACDCDVAGIVDCWILCMLLACGDLVALGRRGGGEALASTLRHEMLCTDAFISISTPLSFSLSCQNEIPTNATQPK